MNRLLRVVLVALALGVISASPALATDKSDQANVPTELRVPAGHKRVLQTIGRGVQMYDCVDGAWKFRAPKADIFDEKSGKQVAIHYAGPTWESTRDGSKVVGVLDAPPLAAPNPQRDIPWLRLRATSNAGTGVLAEVDYIQRLDTAGGIAPAGACMAGQTAEVPYSSTYDFWAPKE